MTDPLLCAALRSDPTQLAIQPPTRLPAHPTFVVDVVVQEEVDSGGDAGE